MDKKFASCKTAQEVLVALGVNAETRKINSDVAKETANSKDRFLLTLQTLKPLQLVEALGNVNLAYEMWSLGRCAIFADISYLLGIKAGDACDKKEDCGSCKVAAKKKTATAKKGAKRCG